MVKQVNLAYAENTGHSNSDKREGVKMNITDVRVRRVENGGRMKAIVSVTLDNEFVIHDIRIVDGDRGLFIAMPSRKTPAGDYRDVAHPINSETRAKLQEKIMEVFNTIPTEVVG
jgi:stage V sporulation protein G